MTGTCRRGGQTTALETQTSSRLLARLACSRREPGGGPGEGLLATGGKGGTRTPPRADDSLTAEFAGRGTGASLFSSLQMQTIECRHLISNRGPGSAVQAGELCIFPDSQAPAIAWRNSSYCVAEGRSASCHGQASGGRPRDLKSICSQPALAVPEQKVKLAGGDHMHAACAGLVEEALEATYMSVGALASQSSCMPPMLEEGRTTYVLRHAGAIPVHSRRREGKYWISFRARRVAGDCGECCNQTACASHCFWALLGWAGRRIVGAQRAMRQAGRLE